MNKRALPLFPLNTVLFPGGLLALRIFEARYLDLVRECAREASCFGVCLIVGGREVGDPAVPAAIGTEARIVDFQTLPDGLLGITCRGEARFRVVRTRVRDNGLLIGEVEDLQPEPAQPVPAEFALLATILERLVEQIGAPFGEARKQDFDDAAWVGHRLAEILPLNAEERQGLLQLGDPIERLRHLAHFLPRFQRD
ncbi:MAG TPA: LON peptidase substrate-binding domain-containing protein [Xanthomonadaceae bacterium]|nr:LON peptidase substrate-binding domain-containing protein [Xanthomonadaceae bacterium]